LLEHGGRLRQAAYSYGIPLQDWLDLSTGINPNGWPVPEIPGSCWLRLPEDDDELLPAAQAYYKNTSLIAVAGSQAAIQILPQLRPISRVGVLHPAYAEHAASWKKSGHYVRIVDESSIETQLNQLDVLILVNPNNPTGKLWPPDMLLAWHARLSRRGGWLIVDEAFIDSMPDFSLAPLPNKPGLIVLRSLGKFFGLAGIRCGFLLTEHPLLETVAERLGPWTISNASRYIATKALQDFSRQQQAILDLKRQGQRLRELLNQSDWKVAGGTDLFQWIETAAATELHDSLARQGILTRLFPDPSSIRIGLPKQELEWERLAKALSEPVITRLAKR
jgi:cobalamin biosynthetic protein CobC